MLLLNAKVFSDVANLNECIRQISRDKFFVTLVQHSFIVGLSQNTIAVSEVLASDSYLYPAPDRWSAIDAYDLKH